MFSAERLSFKRLSLKKAYDSDKDNVLHDFYIPVLSHSVEYKRLAGFFSSSSLAAAARGIAKFMINGGRMKLICGVRLSKSDIEAIQEARENLATVISNRMLEELEDLENEFVRDHVKALGWMVARGRLSVKVALALDDNDLLIAGRYVEAESLFHLKVGIFQDEEGNMISFSGSVNETASAWLDNIEEFKVFRSWVEQERDYLDADCERFGRLWGGTAKRTVVMDIPTAVERRLIEIAPDDIGDIRLERWMTKANRKRGCIIELRDYQEDAVERWLDRGRKGIFEMATGTGKTFTALACLQRILTEDKGLLAVVTCPYQHLVSQWEREIDNYGLEFGELIVADGSHPGWKKRFAKALIDISLGYIRSVVVLTTHHTFSSRDFTAVVKQHKERTKALLIGDEVHGVGSKKRSAGLLEEYDFRLGLSATPERWFDAEGTKIIWDYFGGTVFEFGLKDAIRSGCLVPYKYWPKFVGLMEKEIEEYVDKTRAIAAKLGNICGSDEHDELLERPLFKIIFALRANIIKNAVAKYGALKSILDEIGRPVEWTIIYCTPQQIDEVMNVVNERGLVAHRFTMEEGTKPESRYHNLSERDFILRKFAEKDYQVLVAMKCLDEGVDVPPARTAVLMASSGNPREYIQRIGRVLRRFKNKEEAAIYDVIVVPSLSRLPLELRGVEKKIFEKEKRRYRYIAKCALNATETLKALYEMEDNLFGDVL